MKNWPRRARIALLVVVCLYPKESNGQDGHHWTEQFGNRSMLLNGAVIGSVEDLGAVYYNPARIAQFESPSFVISAKVYQLSRVQIKDGLGDGINLNNSKFGGGPSLVSGSFKVGFWPRHKFAYAFLTKTRFDQTFAFKIDDYGDFVEAFPGEEYFSGEIIVSKKARDEWIGGSWAYALSDHWSVGLSGFYSAVDQSANYNLQLQAYKDEEGTGMLLNKRSYSFKTHNLVLKGGIAWQSEKVSAGLTVKGPKMQGLGSGNTGYEQFLAGIDTAGDGSTNDVYIINNQSNLDVTYKTPWSVGFGTGIRIGRSILHMSAEWFDKVPLFTVLQSAPFEAQSTRETIQMTVVDEFNSVVNFGVGAEIYVNPRVSFFGSFATDYSAVPKEASRFSELENETGNTSFRSDIYHFGFGTDLKTKIANLTLGATYATSRETVDRTLDFEEGMGSMNTTSEIIYSRWRFLVGFEFPFIDKVKKKASGEE